MKAMGVGLWKFALRDVEVMRRPSGQPEIALYRKAAELAEARGVTTWHLTLTHTDSMAMAVAGRAFRRPGRRGGSRVKPILTPHEMAAADQAAVAAGTPVEVLMERAGCAVAWRVRKVMGGTYGRRVVVICGKGNNGGDGLVAAAVLRAWGVRVDVLTLEAGIDPDGLARVLGRADAVVDSMYGTGFRGALEGDAARVAEATRMPDAERGCGRRHPFGRRRRDGRVRRARGTRRSHRCVRRVEAGDSCSTRVVRTPALSRWSTSGLTR